MNLRVNNRVTSYPVALEDVSATTNNDLTRSTRDVSSTPVQQTQRPSNSQRGDSQLRQSLIRERINEQPIPLRAGTVIEGTGGLGAPTTRDAVRSISTFYPVDGDRPPPDFVRRIVLESFRRNGVTPPPGWEQQFQGYLEKDGFDPAGAPQKWTVRTYLVDGKPQKGIVVGASPDADRSIIDAVRGFTDQRIDPRQVESMQKTLRENPDAELDLSRYSEPLKGDYEAVANVIRGREHAVSRGEAQWAPWTRDRIKEARERFVGTTQESAVGALLDETEASVARAAPNLGANVSGSGTVGALRTLAAGGYVAPQVIDALPDRASSSVVDPTSKEAVRQVYSDLIGMSRSLDNLPQFDALRARVDTALQPGSALHRVVGKEELAQLQAARDDLVRRRPTEAPQQAQVVENRTAPVNDGRESFIVSNVDELAKQAEAREHPGYQSTDDDGKIDYECAQLPQRWQNDQEGFIESRSAIFVKESNRQRRLMQNWTQGPTVTYGMDLPSGSVLASGWVDGKYPGKESGNHTLIFHKWGEQDGKKGMWVIETVHDKPRYAFRTDLDSFSVVRIPPPTPR